MFSCQESTVADQPQPKRFVYDPIHHEQDTTTPWLRTTEWPRHFNGLYLSGVCLATLGPFTSQTLPDLAGWNCDPACDPGDDIRDEIIRNIILSIAGRGFDCIMAKCLGCVDSTNRPLLEVMGSTIAGMRYSRRRLGRLLPASEHKYIQVWKRFIWFILRSVSLPGDSTRRSAMGVSVDADIVQCAQLIFDLLKRYIQGSESEKEDLVGSLSGHEGVLSVARSIQRIEAKIDGTVPGEEKHKVRGMKRLRVVREDGLAIATRAVKRVEVMKAVVIDNSKVS